MPANAPEEGTVVLLKQQVEENPYVASPPELGVTEPDA
jgi:hypothetical protein